MLACSGCSCCFRRIGRSAVFVTVTLGHDPRHRRDARLFSRYLRIALVMISRLSRPIDVCVSSFGRAIYMSRLVLPLDGPCTFQVKQWILLLASVSRVADVDLQRLLPASLKLGLRDMATTSRARLASPPGRRSMPWRVTDTAGGSLTCGWRGRPSLLVQASRDKSRRASRSRIPELASLPPSASIQTVRGSSSTSGLDSKRPTITGRKRAQTRRHVCTVSGVSHARPSAPGRAAAELARDALRKLRTRRHFCSARAGAAGRPRRGPAQQGGRPVRAAGITSRGEQHDVADEVWIDATTHYRTCCACSARSSRTPCAMRGRAVSSRSWIPVTTEHFV